jgi:hypothetical protein
MLEEKKLKEWYSWGKEAYKSTASMMRINRSHPDYDSIEKIEAVHDRYGDSYMLSEERKLRLKNNFNYSDNDINEAIKQFKKGYDSSRQWYKKADKKFQDIIDSYMPVIKEAEEYAKSIDVSDIQDGFPCGSAHLYIQEVAEMEELKKAVGHFNSSKGTDVYKYALPIKLPSYGQCISFDERICQKVADFLRSKGLFVNTYSWID